MHRLKGKGHDTGIMKYSAVNFYAFYPVQLEEAFNLLAFPPSTAHQQVTELVYRTQFLENMTPLQDSKESTLSIQKIDIVPSNMSGRSTVCDMMNCDISFNLCREKDKLLRRDVVLLDHHG